MSNWERLRRTERVSERFGWTPYLSNRLTIAQQRDVLKRVGEMEDEIARLKRDNEDLTQAIQHLLTIGLQTL